MSIKKKVILIISILLAVALVAGAIVLFCVLIPQREEDKQWQQQVQAYRDAKTMQYQQENEAYEDYEVDVAFLGDSLTDGCDLEKYYSKYVVSNRGIGGDTTYDLEGRLQVSVYDLKPKVAVMLIGGNNLDTMFKNYENILKGLQTNLPQTKVILVSLTAMGEDWAYKNHIAAYNNVKIRLLAEKYGFTYVDVFSLLLDEETDEIRKEYTVEGVHLTHEGYEILTGAIIPAIDALLCDTHP